MARIIKEIEESHHLAEKCSIYRYGCNNWSQATRTDSTRHADFLDAVHGHHGTNETLRMHDKIETGPKSRHELSREDRKASEHQWSFVSTA